METIAARLVKTLDYIASPDEDTQSVVVHLVPRTVVLENAATLGALSPLLASLHCAHLGYACDGYACHQAGGSASVPCGDEGCEEEGYSLTCCGVHTPGALALTPFEVHRRLEGHPALAALVVSVLQHNNAASPRPLIVLVEGVDVVDYDVVQEEGEEGEGQGEGLPRRSLPAALRYALGLVTCTSCWRAARDGHGGVSAAGAACPPRLLVLLLRHSHLLPEWLPLPAGGTPTEVNDPRQGHPPHPPAPLLMLRGRAGVAGQAGRRAGACAGRVPVECWVRVRGTEGERRSGAPERAPLTITAQQGDAPLWPGWAGYSALKEELLDRVIRPMQAVSLSRARAAGCDVGETERQTASLAGAMAALGVRPPTGVLLYGPPGTGKTMIAESLARACGVMLVHVSCAHLLSRYVGDSEGGIRRIFASARALAPALILLDGIDAIAGARAGLQSLVTSSSPTPPTAGVASGSILDRLLATLLAEMDGVGERRGGGHATTSTTPGQDCTAQTVLVVGTCTVPAGGCLVLDTALLRPGRFEVSFAVPPPTSQDRRAILHAGAVQWQDRAVRAGLQGCDFPPALLDAVSTSTRECGVWSAPSLLSLVHEAGVQAVARTLEAGGGRGEVGHHDFLAAAAVLGLPVS